MTPTIPGLMSDVVTNMVTQYTTKLSRLNAYLETERHYRAVSVAFDENKLTQLIKHIAADNSDTNIKTAVQNVLSVLETQEAKVLTRPLSLLVNTL